MGVKWGSIGRFWGRFCGFAWVGGGIWRLAFWACDVGMWALGWLAWLMDLERGLRLTVIMVGMRHPKGQGVKVTGGGRIAGLGDGALSESGFSGLGAHCVVGTARAGMAAASGGKGVLASVAHAYPVCGYGVV